MYKYNYVKVTCDLVSWGLGVGNVYGIVDDYHNIINNAAANGWRYVGYLPTLQRGTGHVEEMTLIFEKEITE